MEILLLIAGAVILMDGVAYFLVLPGSEFREWLSARRGRAWMRAWPPVQWALDSEKARLSIGVIQSVLGIALISVYYLIR